MRTFTRAAAALAAALALAACVGPTTTVKTVDTRPAIAIQGAAGGLTPVERPAGHAALRREHAGGDDRPSLLQQWRRAVRLALPYGIAVNSTGITAGG